MRNRGMCLLPRRCHRPFSIRPIPIRCLNRVTDPSRRQLQAPLPDMWLRRQRMNAYRIRPLALIHGPQSQDRARSTTGPALQSFGQRRSLIPTITRPSDMAMVARGGGGGMDIGSERRPVRNRKSCFPLKSRTTSQPRLSSFPLSDYRAVQGAVFATSGPKAASTIAQAATRPNARRRDAIFRRTKSM
jgi:hypothetical protein